MTLLRCTVLLTLVFSLAGQAKDRIEDSLPHGVETLAFTPREMLDLDISEFLHANAPELVPHTAAIGHWAAYYHVSPRSLVALMVHQADPLAYDARGVSIDTNRPFGALSGASGFNAQLIDVTQRLSAAYFPTDEAAANEPSGLRVERTLRLILDRGDDALTGDEVLRFGQIHQAFDGGRGEEADVPQTPQAVGAVETAVSFQFPWPSGESWRGGGAHSSQMQSLDFLAQFSDWGDAGVHDHWVAAANGGTAKVWSECGMSVIDPSATWVSDYYHLENIQVADNESVAQDQVLANYADDEATAICQGGSSTGPHVHFSIARDDQWQPIHNRILSTFRVVMESEEAYDTNCEVSYYEPLEGGAKVCPWSELYNAGALQEALFVLTVNNGSGDGEYAAGTVVEVAADAPEPGFEFDQWTGDTGGLGNVSSPMTTFTMGDATAEITANYIEVAAPLFLLTVNNGTGDGEYAAGAVVEVTADAPEPGMQFSHWTGNIDGLANPEAASTTYTMPGANAEITAQYAQAPPMLFVLEVIRGSGDGEYAAGVVVEVSADAPDPGMVFDRWTGNTGNLASVEAATTTITMPDANVEIAATYRESGPQPGSFLLSVINGSGSGEYAAGAEVPVAAEPAPEGLRFERWIGNIDGLADVAASSTIYTMPDANAELAAKYLELPEDDCAGGPDFNDNGIKDACESEVQAITGSWFDPASSGEGFMIHGVEEDLAVMYFYGYDTNGDRLWLIATSAGPFHWGRTLVFDAFRTSGGTFTDFDAASVTEQRWGEIRLRITNCREGQVLLELPQGSKVLNLVRLGDVARSPCSADGQPRESDALTGSWYDETQSGQGFAVHKVSASLGIVYFYGFDDAGRNLWLLGTWEGAGPWGAPVVIPMLRVSGGTFAEVDPADINEEAWGTLTLDIKSCAEGTATLSGLDGAQVLNIEQLAGSFGMECP